MKHRMIAIGNFFFTYRNRLFPLLIVALFALQRPATTVLGDEAGMDIKDAAAIAVALLGLALRGFVIGFAYIKRGGLHKKVYAETLVTQGVFGICRNPLYVGNVLIYVGVFLLHGAPVVFIGGIALFVFIYQCIILAEERYLYEKFGSAYTEYCRNVSRWLFNFRNFRKATQGMRFNFWLAIKKDYSTIATTLTTLCLTLMYKSLDAADTAAHQRHVTWLVWCILLIGIWAGTIRYFKKRGRMSVAP